MEPARGQIFLDWLDLPRGLRCLDVGCGNGAFTEVLVARAGPAQVTGIDPSPEQVAYAQNRPGAKPATFRVGDAQSVPFENDAFDAAIMALVISFVPDPAKAVNEMARVVRPGGRVGAYMWDLSNNSQPHGPCYTAMKALGMAAVSLPNRVASLQDTMRTLWKHAGLKRPTRARLRSRLRFPISTTFGIPTPWLSG